MTLSYLLRSNKRLATFRKQLGNILTQGKMYFQIKLDRPLGYAKLSTVLIIQ